MARSTELSDAIDAALALDDRPVVGVVWCDPSVPGSAKGQTGLAVYGWEAKVPSWYSGVPISQEAFRWLGRRVARICKRGERVLYAAEKDAFGPSVGRGLGISVGVFEGLLVDLNAIATDTRLDIASVTWRRGAGVDAKGRDAVKAQAVKLARAQLGPRATGITDHAAEAVLAATWLRALIQAAQARRAP